MRPLGWTLIQYGRRPHKKRKFGHTDTGNVCTQKKDYVRIQQKGSCPQAKERGQRNQTSGHPDLGLPASRTVKKQISVIKATLSVVFCYDSPRKLIQQVSQ